MTDGNSAFAEEFAGLAPYYCARQAPTRVRGKGAKDGKEDWLLEIRIGNRANNASWVAGGD